jgi:hypothetical protein
MNSGSHWKVYLPYTQAYGTNAGIADPRHAFKVGPYSALIFDVELESVQRRPAPPVMRQPAPGNPAAPAPARGMGTPPPAAMATPPQTTSGIVRVPSSEEAAKGEQPHVMTDAEIAEAKAAAEAKAKAEAEAAKAAQASATNR